MRPRSWHPITEWRSPPSIDINCTVHCLQPWPPADIIASHCAFSGEGQSEKRGSGGTMFGGDDLRIP